MIKILFNNTLVVEKLAKEASIHFALALHESSNVTHEINLIYEETDEVFLTLNKE